MILQPFKGPRTYLARVSKGEISLPVNRVSSIKNSKKLANNKHVFRSVRDSYGKRNAQRSKNTSGLLPLLPVYKKNPIIIVFASNSIFSMTDYLNWQIKLWLHFIEFYHFKQIMRISKLKPGFQSLH